MEIERDLMLADLWREYCDHLAAQGIDPNQPPSWAQSFRVFANHRVKPRLKTLGPAQYAAWKSLGGAELATRAEERRAISDRVTRWWGEALDLLDQLISVAEEFGMVHAHRLVAAQGHSPKTYPLLINLHARGVQVAEETLALLRSGFAAGAEARWRTLHETAVVAAFIAKHGEPVAEQYAAHDLVRVKNAMESEQKHHRELGLEPYSEEEMREARAEFAKLGEQYGAAFLDDHGWAASALGRKPGGRGPTFSEIEASLDLRFFRAAYRSASQAIHAGPGALVDNPGKPEGAMPIFLTCGTEFGLLEPGARTAGSVGLLSRALMEWRPFPFDQIALAAMQHMIVDVGRRFFTCQERLAADLATRTSGAAP